MLNASQEFKDSIDSESHDVKALVRVCWDKQEATSLNWFRLDESTLDSGALLTSEAFLQDESITSILSNYDKFQYTNEDTYVISAEGFDEMHGDLNQAVSKEADIVFSNSDGRFTPKTDRNLLQNPGFDYLNLDYWTVDTTKGSYSLTNDVSSGLGALYMVKSGIGTMSVKSDPVTVTANFGYTGSIFAKGTGELNLAVVASGLNGDIASGIIAGQQLTSSYQLFNIGYIMPSALSGTQTAYLRADLSGMAQGAITDSQFVENFDTDTYEDTALTNADWVTSSRKVILPYGTKLSTTKYYGPINHNYGYSMGTLAVSGGSISSKNLKYSFWFIANASKTLNKIHLLTSGTNLTCNVTIGIQRDNGNNQPDGNWLSSTTGDLIYAHGGWNVIDIPNINLNIGTKYHVVVQYSSGSGSLWFLTINCYPSISSTNWRCSYPLYIANQHPTFLLEYTDMTYFGSVYTSLQFSNSVYGSQYITPTADWNLDKITFLIKRGGGGSSYYGNVSIKIVRDSDKVTIYDSGTILTASDISDNISIKYHSCNILLENGESYHIVFLNSRGGTLSYYGYHIGNGYCSSNSSPYIDSNHNFEGQSSKGQYSYNLTSYNDYRGLDLAIKLDYRISTTQYEQTASVYSLTTDSAANPIHYATLIPADTASGTAYVNYYLSNNGGADWQSVSSGVQCNFNTLASDLRWKATLNTTDQTITPEINTVVINYSHGTAGVEATLDNAKLEQGQLTNYDQTFIGDKILPKRPIKVYIDSDGKNIQKFTGVTEGIYPDIISDEISFHCLDFSKELEAKQATTAMYQNLSTCSGISLLAAEAGIASGTVEIDAGRHIIPFMWFQEGSIWYYMQQIAEAEGGRVFFDEDGVLKFWNRDHFISSGTAVDTLNFDKTTNLSWRIDKDNIKNHIIVKATPRSVQARQLVYTHGTYEEIRPGETKEVWCRFVDADRNNEGLPCVGVEQPIASSSTTSGYLANSRPDGTGSNLTSSVVVSSWYGFAESARINFRNNGTQTAYITSLTIWAAPAKVTEDIYEEAKDDDSIALYGDQVLQIENNLINSRSIARSIAYKKLEELKDPKTHLKADVSGKGYYQVGDLVTVQDDFLDTTTGSGTYQDLMIKSNQWQITDDLYQKLEFEKIVILPWFILDQSTLDDGYVLFI